MTFEEIKKEYSELSFPVDHEKRFDLLTKLISINSESETEVIEIAELILDILAELAFSYQYIRGNDEQRILKWIDINWSISVTYLEITIGILCHLDTKYSIPFLNEKKSNEKVLMKIHIIDEALNELTQLTRNSG